MPCNYLVKFDGEKYKHLIITTCNNNHNPAFAAVKHFSNCNRGLSPKSFDEAGFTANRKIWVVSVAGLAIFEECYEIGTGPVKIVKDMNAPPVGDNVFDGVGWVARRICEKPPKLLAGLEKYLEEEATSPLSSDQESTVSSD